MAAGHLMDPAFNLAARSGDLFFPVSPFAPTVFACRVSIRS
jgi:hypothetical protein